MSRIQSKVVFNTPLESNPSNLYQETMKGFLHIWRTGDCLGRAISPSVVIFLDRDHEISQDQMMQKVRQIEGFPFFVCLVGDFVRIRSHGKENAVKLTTI